MLLTFKIARNVDINSLLASHRYEQLLQSFNPISARVTSRKLLIWTYRTSLGSENGS
jgi:hypothetical protein